jgi:hypothetical protein
MVRASFPSHQYTVTLKNTISYRTKQREICQVCLFKNTEKLVVIIFSTGTVCVSKKCTSFALGAISVILVRKSAKF